MGYVAKLSMCSTRSLHFTNKCTTSSKTSNARSIHRTVWNLCLRSALLDVDDGSLTVGCLVQDQESLSLLIELLYNVGALLLLVDTCLPGKVPVSKESRRPCNSWPRSDERTINRGSCSVHWHRGFGSRKRPSHEALSEDWIHTRDEVSPRSDGVTDGYSTPKPSSVRCLGYPQNYLRGFPIQEKAVRFILALLLQMDVCGMLKHYPNPAHR